MGKQKLNKYEVMLIKYLIKNGYNDVFIAEFMGKCTHKNIWKIRTGIRWVEIGTPTDALGTRLLVNWVHNRFETPLI